MSSTTEQFGFFMEYTNLWSNGRYDAICSVVFFVVPCSGRRIRSLLFSFMLRTASR